MSYFKNFPYINYSFIIDGKPTLIPVKDIVLNVRFLKTIFDNVALYDTYTVKDGETPEYISEKLYGTPYYHWVILLFNERFDYYNDWPLTSNQLEEYVNRVCVDPYAQHKLYGEDHYVDTDGNVVDGPEYGNNDSSIVAITNIEYYSIENDKKRDIKLINPNLISTVSAELTAAFKKQNYDNR